MKVDRTGIVLFKRTYWPHLNLIIATHIQSQGMFIVNSVVY